jgi:hypothetical protein
MTPVKVGSQARLKPGQGRGEGACQPLRQNLVTAQFRTQGGFESCWNCILFCRKSASHFCRNCGFLNANPHAKPPRTFAGFALPDVAIAGGKPLRTFPAIAFFSTQIQAQNRFALLLDLL